MEIDIIQYTAAQFAVLTEEQILEVREAQLKKNSLMRTLEKRLQEEKERLVNNGIFLSNIWAALESKLRAECEEEIAWIRDSLLFYLRYTGKENVDTEAPYLVDYSLSDEERVAIVRDYYMSAYTDAEERIEAYENDDVAKQYLGEYYAPMYDYFYVYVE